MSRPSHQLPRDIFEAITKLEDLVRANAVFTFDANGDVVGGHSEEFMLSAVAVGAARDDLAELILRASTPPELSTHDGHLEVDNRDHTIARDNRAVRGVCICGWNTGWDNGWHKTADTSRAIRNHLEAYPASVAS
jgi:hypothetical protein